MIVKPNEIGFDGFYPLMIQSIIPRPIAWVLSENPDQGFNVAPFSFFNGVTSEPPILMISVGWKDDTTKKDTWINIDERLHFVVHIPPVSLAQELVATSAALPHMESELTHTNLKTIPMPDWPLPRLEGPLVAMLCRKHRIFEIGEEKQGLILGEITTLWVDDQAAMHKQGRTYLDAKKIDPLLRLGGKEYGSLGSLFPLNRPK